MAYSSHSHNYDRCNLGSTGYGQERRCMSLLHCIVLDPNNLMRVIRYIGYLLRILVDGHPTLTSIFTPMSAMYILSGLFIAHGSNRAYQGHGQARLTSHPRTRALTTRRTPMTFPWDQMQSTWATAGSPACWEIAGTCGTR